MSRCASCGADLVPGNRFCLACGALTDEGARTVPTAPVPPVGESTLPGPGAAGAPTVQVDRPTGPPTTPDSDTGPSPRRRSRLPLLVGSAAVLTAAAVGGALLSGGGAGSLGGSVTGGPVGVAGALTPASVTATCAAPDGVDAGGATVSYDPRNVADGDPATAWRCPGGTGGQTLTLTFDGPVSVTGVGLVPGYAKVDEVDGTDRFVENRTVTRATWSFDGGGSAEQVLDRPAPRLATVTLTRPVTTRSVTLRIDETGNPDAPRDFTAVSDVVVLGDR